MFVKKTQTEIDAMSAPDADKYFAEKEAHDALQIKTLIDDAVGKGTEGLVLQDTVHGIVKTAVETATKDLSDTIEEQGKTLAKLKENKGVMSKPDFMDSFKEQYDALAKDGEYSIKGSEKVSIDVTKVTISTDVLSVDAVSSGAFPAAGSTQAIGAGVRTVMAQNIGFATYRKPYSPIMEVVDVMPLDNSTLLVINETVTGDAAITPECTLKPIVKLTYATQEQSADPVAAEWATTTKLRRFYPMIANRMQAKVAELVMDKVPAAVLASVVAGGTAFTANAALAINDNPNDYDAIGAVIAQLENLGFVPNAIILNPIAYRNMIQDKGEDGTYNLWNGNAISLVGDYGLYWGGRVIRWVLDPTIAVDSFIVGDLIQTVKVGLDNELLYFETDGRTDAAATTASGLSRNIRTHVLERFVVTIIPTATRIGLVKDTFSNVKTLITAA